MGNDPNNERNILAGDGNVISKNLRLITLFAAYCVIFIAAISLIGYYIPGLGVLGSVQEDYIPMAPATSLSFIVFSVAIIAGKTEIKFLRYLLILGTSACILFGFLEGIEYYIGKDISLEDEIFRGKGFLEKIPIGRMSPVAGAMFMFSGIAILLSMFRNSTRRNIGGIFSCLVLLGNLVLTLAYLYGSPMMYGEGSLIPLAFNTALAFMLLETAAIFFAGPDTFPLFLFVGSSMRCRLLKFIMPLCVLPVIFSSLLLVYTINHTQMNLALLTAMFIVLASLVAGLMSTWFSRHLGNAIDDAENSAQQAIEALRKSEAMLNDVGRTAKIGGWEMDLITRKAKWTKESYRIVEIDEGDPIPGPDQHVDYYLPEYRRLVRDSIAKLIENDTPVEYDAKFKTVKGNIKWGRVFGKAIRENGKCVKIFGTFQDITEQKNTEERIRKSEELLRNAISKAPFPVMIHSEDGKVLAISKAWSDITGYSIDDIPTIPEWIKRAHEKKDYDYVKNLISKLYEISNDLTGEYEIITSTGEKRIWHLSSSPLGRLSGSSRAAITVGIDVTERKMEEDSLRKAKEAAESTSQTKSEFLSTMSHEIRTPLNGIIGFTSLLAEHFKEEIEQDEKVAESFRVIEQCGESLLGIINDVLELSRIESGQFKKFEEKFSPESLIHSVVETFFFRAKEKNIELMFIPENLPETVIADKLRLKQILFNLLGNAIKFTDNGSVKVVADFDENSGNIHIEIVDTGIGIPKEKLDKIMTPFYQVDQSSSRSKGGTGLGLAIVSRMLEQLGGSVKIESKLGKGTEVNVSFPVKIP